MTTHQNAQSETGTDAATQASAAELVPALVARVYEEAPPALRARLLEHLLRPLSLLSISAVANGIFARIVLGRGWHNLHANADDANRIHGSDVAALVNHVQQVSVQAIDSLTGVIGNSPVLAGSAAAAMLITLLSTQRRAPAPLIDDDFDPIA